ncbi:AMP-binding protein [Frigoribacterium sp. VKM Ac-2836]|uniref:AMP-binding protein n=1 Tax=Frigoribacterium sp. VKM Ac-2836 TaxID=2739014 RepID=UPI001566CCD2|nr:AMP-binding protein [Frigoribacterium sp. VKM Ac-2836]NRD25246.1 AMP-binding protein [Frigoribacterium sp. VKM Ac-2836]
MTRTLRVVDARHPGAVLDGLRDALEGGPAIAPRADDRAPADLPGTVPQAVSLVVETSGSSGRPKRVALSSDAVLAGAAAADGALMGPGQWVLALPAHYVAGLNVLVRSLAAGTEPALLAPGHFDPRAFVDAAAGLDHPTRYSSLVPAQLATALDAAEADPVVAEALRRFDAVLIGGQATPATLVGRARRLGVTVVRTYGSSETSGGCVYDGVPVGRTRVEVVDGQVELGGPSLAEGYLDDPERTAAAFVMRDGLRWYRTGDAGTVSSDGVLTVSGRIDDVIVSGGEKVSLGVVERAVREQPGLADAVVVRAAHARWGEVPVVVTAAAPPPSGAADDLAALRRAVAVVAGRAAAPDRIVRVDVVPLLPSGKPDRVALTRLVRDLAAS